MAFDIGKADRRVVIQARTNTRDDQGSAVTTFADEKTVWAQKVGTTGGEARRAGAIRAETNLILRIRYHSTLTPQHRLYFEGKYYDILEVMEEGRRESQMIQAKHTGGSAS